MQIASYVPFASARLTAPLGMGYGPYFIKERKGGICVCSGCKGPIQVPGSTVLPPDDKFVIAHEESEYYPSNNQWKLGRK